MSGPILLALPGASLMRLSVIDDRTIRVECPGCGAVQTYRPRAGRTRHATFRHVSDDCPTLAKIDRALLMARPPSEAM